MKCNLLVTVSRISITTLGRMIAKCRQNFGSSLKRRSVNRQARRRWIAQDYAGGWGILNWKFQEAGGNRISKSEFRSPKSEKQQDWTASIDAPIWRYFSDFGLHPVRRRVPTRLAPVIPG